MSGEKTYRAKHRNPLVQSDEAIRELSAPNFAVLIPDTFGEHLIYSDFVALRSVFRRLVSRFRRNPLWSSGKPDTGWRIIAASHRQQRFPQYFYLVNPIITAISLRNHIFSSYTVESEANDLLNLTPHAASATIIRKKMGGTGHASQRSASRQVGVRQPCVRKTRIPPSSGA